MSAGSRSTLTLGMLALLGFALVVALRYPGGSAPAPGVPARTSAPSSASPLFSGASDTGDARAAEPAAAAKIAAHPLEETEPSTPVGRAEGVIHFSRQPKGRDAAGALIDMEVRSAVGMWQPGENVMRIVLLEAAPKGEQVGQLLNAVQFGGLGNVSRRSAVLELHFLPTAQAFDRNELDSARLIVSDGNVTSTADALNGLTWTGSLPSPQLEPPPGAENPTVELSSGGDTVFSDRVTWLQSWRFSLTVPVITRN